MDNRRESNDSQGTRIVYKIGLRSASLAVRLARAIGYAILGGAVIALVVLVHHLESRPDLEVWHRAQLDEEFTADANVTTFAEYLALEDRLFEELEAEVFERIDDEDRSNINRFNHGSLADPGRWPRNWNRTFELPGEPDSVGILLLHGMSDSPYSLRAFAESSSDRGAWVVGLRLPGHGTAPAGLIDIRWDDLAAAVPIGVRHLRESVSGPIYIVGYSTGATLAVHYALRSLRDESLPPVDGVVLISPAIRVSGVVRFAAWQARLGHVLGLEKLAWNDIYPEYDPFKYGSFTVNAGDVVRRLADEVQNEVEKSSPADLDRLPPVLAFQSAVDATVVVGGIVDRVFVHLPDNGSELVLFDINRTPDIETVLAEDPRSFLQEVIGGPPRAYRVSLLTNREGSDELEMHVREAGSDEKTVVDPGLRWPKGIYSLSHVALPTPPDDPLYGGDPSVESPGVELGRLAFRGERGVLLVPPSAMLRLQWNPFYYRMEEWIFEFMGM